MSKKLPKKEICKWDRKTLNEALPLLVPQILNARYVCRKCGRAAMEKRLLCKPARLNSIPNESSDPA